MTLSVVFIFSVVALHGMYTQSQQLDEANNRIVIAKVMRRFSA